MAEIEDCVTMTQFNEMKQSMDKLTANVQALITFKIALIMMPMQVNIEMMLRKHKKKLLLEL